jgi:hypothetical protein
VKDTKGQALAGGPPLTRVEVMFERMVGGGESFWAVVYEPFMSRDLTREDLQGIVRRGLELTGGNYKSLLSLFNMALDDYKRLLNFLRKFQSHVPIQEFRAALPARLRENASRPAVGE